MCGSAVFFTPGVTRRQSSWAPPSTRWRVRSTTGDRRRRPLGRCGRGPRLRPSPAPIIDLSATGHQPMTSACGRYVITYNGEIYNFREVRQILEQRGHRFRGHSDTEVLLAATTEWGIEQTLRACTACSPCAVGPRGAPADPRARPRRQEAAVLRLVRPNVPVRVGAEGPASSPRIRWRDRPRRARPARPARLGAGAVFDLSGHPQAAAGRAPQRRCRRWTQRARDRDVLVGEGGGRGRRSSAVSGQLRRGRGCAGHAAWRRSARADDRGRAARRAALGRRRFIRRGRADAGGERDAGAHLLDRLSEPKHDEAPFARAIAAHLGTDHTELYVGPEDSLALVPGLPEMYDEPFADPSQIPTALVLPARPQGRHRGALGRWRGRAVRRLSALSPHVGPLASPPAVAGPGAQGGRGARGSAG